MHPEHSAALPAHRAADAPVRQLDVSHRALVMEILNGTTDSFFDRGDCFRLDTCCDARTAYADLLDVGTRAAGVGTRNVHEEEEIDLVVSTIAELRKRFDVPEGVGRRTKASQRSGPLEPARLALPERKSR
jgi:dihydropteroate synthase